MQRYELGLIAVVALSLLQAGLRIVLGLMMTGALGEGAQNTLNGAIEGQVDDWVLGFNALMFLTLGVLGAIFAVGLPGHASWAWYGTINRQLRDHHLRCMGHYRHPAHRHPGHGAASGIHRLSAMEEDRLRDSGGELRCEHW